VPKRHVGAAIFGDEVMVTTKNWWYNQQSMIFLGILGVWVNLDEGSFHSYFNRSVNRSIYMYLLSVLLQGISD
jgi:hypothetical protein